MRLIVPLKGTVIKYPDGNFGGDWDDPVEPILNFPDFGWRAVSFDLENGTVEVEVTDFPKRDLIKLPGKVARYEKDLTEKEAQDIQDGKVVPQIIPETDAQYESRKAQILANAQALLAKPKEELYELSKAQRLKVIEVKDV